MNNNDQPRNKALEKINAWRNQRASHLSITGHHQAAQALTDENVESLQNINPENLLWVENQQKQRLYPADELCHT